jgi:aspartyl-tRNA(Asn)/glutamyl-tRNA(Gln) amidotransferase subunit A
LGGVVAEHSGLAALLADRALDRARRADDARRRGATAPLLGIPFAVKDTYAAAGAPTTWGSPYFATQTFDQDARSIAQLEDAGAVLVGKVSMSELAGFGAASSPGASVHGVPRNPWRSEAYAGGSSGGSAVAVACDAVPFALGTETGGSVIGPAALCGVTGFRPSPGRISRAGVLTLSPTLDKPGVLARTAADCAAVFAVLDLASTAPRRRGRRPRIGLVPDEPDEWDHDIGPALTAAREELAALGTTHELRRELFGNPTEPLQTIMLAEAAHELRSHLADPAFSVIDPGQDENLRSGLRIPAADYLSALDQRRALLAAFAEAFAHCDVVVAAARTDTARPVGAARRTGGRTVANLLRAAANLAGLPGVSVPAGLSAAGLPVALHVVAPPGQDELALHVATRYQRHTSHHELRPPIAAGPERVVS